MAATNFPFGLTTVSYLDLPCFVTARARARNFHSLCCTCCTFNGLTDTNDALALHHWRTCGARPGHAVHLPDLRIRHHRQAEEYAPLGAPRTPYA